VLDPKVKEGGGMTNRKETLKTAFKDVRCSFPHVIEKANCANVFIFVTSVYWCVKQ